MIDIQMTPEGTSVVLKITEYLGPEKFNKYRNICYDCGARYQPSTKTNIAPVDSVPMFLNRLTEEGFVVKLDPSLADKLQHQANEATELLAVGRERIAAAKAKLAATGRSLFRYQETGIEWLAPRSGALLCDEMGLGKTVQALMALPDKTAALVIVPASVRYNWVKEAQRWRPDLRVSVGGSSSTFRWPEAGEILVTTYGCMPAFGELDDDDDLGLPMPVPGTVIIADEAHALKNGKAARRKKFDKVVQFVRASSGRVWLLTGTPLLNRPPELWSLLQAAGIAEEAFGTWASFVAMFRGMKSQYSYDWGKPSEEVPDRLRRVSLHRRRLEVLKDLPGKLRTDHVVNGLSAEVVAICDAAMEAMAARGIDLNDVSTLASTNASIPFELMSKARSVLAAAKTPAVLELVEEYEQEEIPVVVFSDHRTPIDALATRPGWASITGDTPPDARGKIVEQFQRGELKGIAGTIGAMGTGVTLTKAAHIIFVDMAWTPALNSQAEDRCCRIGQKAEAVIVKRLVTSHPLDQRVLELLTIKQEIIEASVEASAVAGDKLPDSPAESLARAAAQAQQLVSDIKLAEQARMAELAAEKQTLTTQLVQSGICDGRPIDWNDSCTKRTAANIVEDWAAKGLITLAELDLDRASTINGVGFDKMSNEFGHSLANQLRSTGMLSEKQWLSAVKLASKFSRQIGPKPDLAAYN